MFGFKHPYSETFKACVLVSWLTAGRRKEINVAVVFQFRATMEGKLPQFNTRVKLPMTSDRLAVYDGKLAMTEQQNDSVRCKENV